MTKQLCIKEKKIVTYKDIIAVLIILFVLLIFFRDILIGKATFVLPMDAEATYKKYYFMAETLKNGDFPLWDPHLFAGTSLAAYPGIGIFYPFNLLFMALPWGENPFPCFAMDALTLFHFFLCGLNMYILGRSLKRSRIAALCMGVMFMLSSEMLVLQHWKYNLMTYAWSPLILLCLLKIWEDPQNWKYVGLGGIFMGMAALAGPAQPIIVVIFMAAVFTIFAVFYSWRERKKAMWILLSCAVVICAGVLIAAPSFLSNFQYSEHTIRMVDGGAAYLLPGEALTTDSMTEYIIEPSAMKGLVIPENGRLDIGGLFIGFTAMFFAVIGLIKSRKKRFSQFMIVLSIISLLYVFGIGLPYLFQKLPLLNMLREAQIYLIYLHIAAVIFAGAGIDSCFADSCGQKFKIWDISVTGGAVAIAAALLLGIIKQYPKGYFISLFLFICIFLIYLFYRYGKKHGAKRALMAALNGAVAGVVILQMNVNVAVLTNESNEYLDNYGRNDGIYEKKNPFEEIVPEDTDPYRVMSILDEQGDGAAPINEADVAGYYDTYNYGNPVLFRLHIYKQELGGSPFLNLLNIRYLIAEEENYLQSFDNEWMVNFYRENNLTKCGEINGFYDSIKATNETASVILENPNAYGAAWLADEVLHSDSFDDSLEALNQNDPYTTAVIEGNDVELISSDDALEYTVEVQRYEPGEIVYYAETNKESIMVMSELYSHGWKAYIDGAPTEIYLTDALLRGIKLPEGSHTIRVVYEPGTVYAGLCIGGATLAFLIFMIIRWKERMKRVMPIISCVGIGAVTIVFLTFVAGLTNCWYL